MFFVAISITEASMQSTVDNAQDYQGPEEKEKRQEVKA